MHTSQCHINSETTLWCYRLPTESEIKHFWAWVRFGSVVRGTGNSKRNGILNTASHKYSLQHNIRDIFTSPTESRAVPLKWHLTFLTCSAWVHITNRKLPLTSLNACESRNWWTRFFQKWFLSIIQSFYFTGIINKFKSGCDSGCFIQWLF